MSTTLASRRGPGPVGQFQTVPVKAILRFLTIPYICAQRILYLAREVQVFNMLSVHIARQALHLVILLNDSVDAKEGPNEQQQDERIDLGDDLIELEMAMTQWGVATDDLDEYDAQILGIKRQYVQFFKQRFYFHNARDPESDPVFQKLLVYDNRTPEFGQSPQSINLSSLGAQTGSESSAPFRAEPNVAGQLDKLMVPRRPRNSLSHQGHSDLLRDPGPFSLFDGNPISRLDGNPIPRPDAQTIFPERPIYTGSFVAGCFLHLQNGEYLRMLLRNALNSPWWQHQTACGTELDHFGIRHSPKFFECAFCTSVFKTKADLEKCIHAHIRY